MLTVIYEKRLNLGGYKYECIKSLVSGAYVKYKLAEIKR